MPTTKQQLDTPGDRVRWLRGQARMSQHQAAKFIGISSPALSKIEHGNSKAPSATTLMRIAALFEANPDWIMTGKGEPYMKDSTTTSVEMLEVFSQLSPERQAAVLAAAKALMS